MNDAIKHHGILGQKWGVRRYQEEDGSLTALGKKRYTTNYEKTRDALTEDYLALHYRAGGSKLSTSKTVRMMAGHEDRYKTANELFKSLESDVEKRGGIGRVGEATRAEYLKMSYRMKDLKDAGLENTKGISLVSKRNSTVPDDINIQYRYYTDEAIEPSYYDNIKDLEKAIEEAEKKKESERRKETEKVTTNDYDKKEIKKEKNINDKINDAVNSVVEAVKNFPSSVVNGSKDAINKGKSLVDSILKKIKR